MALTHREYRNILNYSLLKIVGGYMCVRSRAPPRSDKSPLKKDYATGQDMSKEPCLHAKWSRRHRVDLFVCVSVCVCVCVCAGACDCKPMWRCVHYSMYLGFCHSFTITIVLVALLFSVSIYMAQFAMYFGLNLHLDLLYCFVVTF